MNKIITLIIIFTINSFSFSKLTNDIYEKYSGDETITSIKLNSIMFYLIKAFDDSDIDEELDWVDAIIVLASQDNGNFAKDLEAKYLQNSYVEMISINDKGSKFDLMVLEEKGDIIELALFVMEEDSSTLILLSGDIDLDKLSDIPKNLNLEGLENLEKVDTSESSRSRRTRRGDTKKE